MAATDYEALVKRLPEMAEAVNRFSSDTVQQKAFEVLLSKLGVETPRASATSPKSRARKSEKAAAGESVDGGAKLKGRKKHSAPSIVKDLNLRAGGKNPFNELVLEKQPRSNDERSLLAVHFLRDLPSVDKVSVDHVYTVYKHQGWKVPTNLRNQLQVIASTKGWLDTSDGDDIKVTVRGENHVEHDMKKQAAA
jgi:hypothetical protein